jgi:thiol-disulfide isomerase/thioredoxin
MCATRECTVLDFQSLSWTGVSVNKWPLHRIGNPGSGLKRSRFRLNCAGDESAQPPTLTGIAAFAQAIVYRLALPHNLLKVGLGTMKKSALIVLLVAGGLAVMVIAIEGARELRVAAARPGADAEPVAVAAKAQPVSSSKTVDDPNELVIRFARNAQPIPPFLMNDLNGQIISTAALRGKVVIVNFWATWCPPCQEEIPEMMELQKEYQGKLQIIGVSMDDGPDGPVKQFADKIGMNYPVVMGSDALSEEYGGIPALPTSYIVDPQGRVVQKHVGLYPKIVYDDEIRALLGMPVQAKIETFEDTGQIFLKNASLATQIPGVSFKGLTSAQKKLALKRMNTEHCTCGCNLTVAQCRITDSSCTTSQKLAQQIVDQIRASSSPPTQPVAQTIRN